MEKEILARIASRLSAKYIDFDSEKRNISLKNHSSRTSSPAAASIHHLLSSSSHCVGILPCLSLKQNRQDCHQQDDIPHLLDRMSRHTRPLISFSPIVLLRNLTMSFGYLLQNHIHDDVYRLLLSEPQNDAYWDLENSTELDRKNSNDLISRENGIWENNDWDGNNSGCQTDPSLQQKDDVLSKLILLCETTKNIRPIAARSNFVTCSHVAMEYSNSELFNGDIFPNSGNASNTSSHICNIEIHFDCEIHIQIPVVKQNIVESQFSNHHNPSNFQSYDTVVIHLSAPGLLFGKFQNCISRPDCFHLRLDTKALYNLMKKECQIISDKVLQSNLSGMFEKYNSSSVREKDSIATQSQLEVDRITTISSRSFDSISTHGKTSPTSKAKTTTPSRSIGSTSSNGKKLAGNKTQTTSRSICSADSTSSNGRTPSSAKANTTSRSFGNTGNVSSIKSKTLNFNKINPCDYDLNSVRSSPSHIGTDESLSPAFNTSINPSSDKNQLSVREVEEGAYSSFPTTGSVGKVSKTNKNTRKIKASPATVELKTVEDLQCLNFMPRVPKSYSRTVVDPFNENSLLLPRSSSSLEKDSVTSRKKNKKSVLARIKDGSKRMGTFS